MGLTIKSDLDTSKGASNGVYIRIDTCRINKVQGEMVFAASLWLDENSSKGFYREYIEDSIGKSEGMIKAEVVYYKDEEDYEGTEVKLPNHFRITFTEKEIIKKPIYETKLVEVDVPYISFDAEGNEVEKVKKVEKEHKVVVREEEVVKNKIDYSVVDRPIVYAYNYMKKELEKLLPGAVIE